MLLKTFFSGLNMESGFTGNSRLSGILTDPMFFQISSKNGRLQARGSANNIIKPPKKTDFLNFLSFFLLLQGFVFPTLAIGKNKFAF